MNILPKKRWHVRTKENIAKVRKDEAEAAEKEKQERLRIESADREARLNILKLKSKQRLLESGVAEPIESEPVDARLEHINLFSDLEHATTSRNKDHDLEEKKKKEEYEKKIGYLTYLGQDTNESLKKKNWYEVLPDSSRYLRGSDIKDTYEKLVLKDQDGKPKTKEMDCKDGEIDWKAKQCLDPINAFKKYCHGKVVNQPPKTEESGSACITKKHNSKKEKHKKDKEKEEKEKKLQKLREARLKREQREKYKTEIFLTGLNATEEKQQEPPINKVKPKYNSQFNPELARQNYR